MKLTIRVPTLEEEKRRVDGLMSRLDWYRSNGYDVLLPSGDVQSEFHTEDYQTGVDQVESQRETILKAADRIKKFSKTWHVVLPQEIVVVMTKYGVGGSYDVDSSRIVLLLKPDGIFLKPPEHLVVHELLHLVSDRSLVEPLGLTHGQKERFVDILCRDAFGDLLPGYRMQPMGDSSIDPYIIGLPNLDLRAALEKFHLSTPLGGPDGS